MNYRERMYQRITRHGEQLNAIYDTDLDPVTLCKKLHRLEAKAHRIAKDQCKGTAAPDAEQQIEAILRKVSQLLPNVQGLQFNGDCRGYALKISDKVVREQGLEIFKDWGGYGILAPDFDGNP